MTSDKSSNTKDVNYWDYLRLDKILGAQEPWSARSGEAAHDEMLFIVIHQAYELWFKEIIHELDSVIRLFDQDHVDEKNIGVAVSRLRRIIEIQKLLIQQVGIVETITPLDFLDFRGYLPGASGFQSMQFRMIENKLGLRPSDRIQYANRPYYAEYNREDIDKVKETESSPNLFSVLNEWLSRTPFIKFDKFDFLQAFLKAYRKMVDEEHRALEHAETMSEAEKNLRRQMTDQAHEFVVKLAEEEAYEKVRTDGQVRFSYKAFIGALFISLYRDQPILQLPYRLLESVTEIDANFNLWRHRHYLMVLKMLGMKMGTGGSSGHDYLYETVKRHNVFFDLYRLSTMFIPRSHLPELDTNIVRNLGFFFSARPAS